MLKGYAGPESLGLRYSLHDALPDTATLLATRDDDAPVGTATVFPDSPLGLPAEEEAVFAAEIARMREGGRHLAEGGRFPETGWIPDEQARVVSRTLIPLSMFLTSANGIHR